MTAPYSPSQIMPSVLASAVEPLPYWFVIGGQAVRCLAPYRPSRDVDFGIDKPANLDDMVMDYFLVQVGSLLTPPMRRLTIQAQTAGVDGR